MLSHVGPPGEVPGFGQEAEEESGTRNILRVSMENSSQSRLSH